ncbi:uncharacterized protein LOC143446734 isoform X2 [Clavelina lepadiformis]
MIVKREREVVQVGQPNLGRPVGVETSKYKELEAKLNESETKKAQAEKEVRDLKDELAQAVKDRDSWNRKHDALKKQLAEIQEQHQKELEKVNTISRENGARADDVSEELRRLRDKLEIKAMQEEHKTKENYDREGYINDLIKENAILKNKVESMLIELNEKEVRWLRARDELKQKIQEKFDEKYAKWMAETDRRMEDLRQQNLLLKSCLSKGLPQDQKSVQSSKSNAPEG